MIESKNFLTKNISFSQLGWRSLKVFFPHDLEELGFCLNLARKKKIPLKIIGNLSNLLIINKKETIFVKLEGPVFKKIEREDNILKVGAGLEVKNLIGYCLKNNLSGLEFLVGIPATMGGIVVNNAGAFGKEIADYVSSITLLNDDGQLHHVERSQLKFGYRSSKLKDKIVIEIELSLKKSSQRKIKELLKSYFQKRITSQEMGFPSLGCIFKNPYGENAGKLIESQGLKGKRRAEAMISLRHANFFLNNNSASEEDFLSLKDLVQRKLWLKKRIWLEPEIEIW